MPPTNPCATPTSAPMRDLLAVCANGDLTRLRELLSDPAFSSEALDCQDGRNTNLHQMVEKAARSGHASLVAHIFAFAREHSVATDAMISRDSMMSALSTSRVDVVAEFVAAQPSCVNMYLGPSGDPLAQAIMGHYRAPADDTNPESRVPLVRYLLEHGADPNGHACQFTKPGFHIYTAVSRGKPLEMVRLLLGHGARIAGSGATVAAAESGRVDVLKLLVEQGADVNEPRSEGIVHFRDKEKTAQRARERPIEAARREGQEAAIEWLSSRGAQ